MRLLSAIALSFLLAGSLRAIDARAEAQLNDRLAEAEQIYRQDGPDAALPLFEQLALESASSDDAIQRGIAIHFVGEAHWRLGNYGQAAEQLELAL